MSALVTAPCASLVAREQRQRAKRWLPSTRSHRGGDVTGGSGGADGGSRQRVMVDARSRSSSSSSNEPSDDGPKASNSSSQDRRQQRARRRADGTGLRREDLPFFIARSDLTWEQPWRFEQIASLAELRLRQQGLAALDDEAAAAAAAQQHDHASASFKVQLPSGLGALVVTGSVAAAVPLRCEFCGEAYVAEVAEPFDGVVHFEGVSATLVAAAEGGEGAELAANELVFAADQNLCDITPLIADAIVGALPTVCLCGGATCRQHAGKQVVWSSSPLPATAASSAAASSPFAKLLAGKQPKKQGRTK